MGSKKLNVAIFIDSELYYGGSYQYEYKILSLIKKYHKNNDNIEFKLYSLKKNILSEYQDLGLEIKVIKENIFQKLHRLGLSNLIYFNFNQKFKNQFSKVEKVLQNDKIDLIYFLSPHTLSLSLTNKPFIFTLYDLGHLQNTEFPEVSNNKIFEIRESLYSVSLKKAQKVIVASKFEKYLVCKKYNLNKDRVIILKYLPNINNLDSIENLNVKDKYNLKNNYIFYPAQLWPHKNHIYILKAIKILRQNYTKDIDVIFSGSNKGNLDYILKSAKLMGIDDLIHYIGFVKNNELPFLYKQSLSLVMPTYLGPSNIPPLEAFAYETLVCYSDFPFNRDEFGDAVFYVDLKNANCLAETILMIENKNINKHEKINAGKVILRNWNDEKFYVELINELNQFKTLRECWK
jgi:hypothetical protein